MLPIKSKYKIAKRLGAAVFEKTQTQKFALSDSRAKKTKRGGRGGSDFGKQLLEKQRVRYTYGLGERQLSQYAKKAYETADPSSTLNRMLEMRADSVVYRAGFAPTRRAARQMVSHGHVLINGARVRTPSYQLNKGDVLTVREGSRTRSIFTKITDEDADKRTPPQWITLDVGSLKAEVVGEPTFTPVEGSGFDYATVFEFYSR